MPNKVSGEEKGLFYQISIEGEFSVKTLRNVREAIEDAMLVGHEQIAFNLSAATFVDSSAIGLLMNFHKKMEKEKGTIYLVAVSKETFDAIESAGIFGIIRHFRTLEEAENEIT